jgi:hypothetical protein
LTAIMLSFKIPSFCSLHNPEHTERSIRKSTSAREIGARLVLKLQ